MIYLIHQNKKVRDLFFLAIIYEAKEIKKLLSYNWHMTNCIYLHFNPNTSTVKIVNFPAHFLMSTDNRLTLLHPSSKLLPSPSPSNQFPFLFCSILCVRAFVCMYLDAPHACNALRGQKRASVSLELKLQTWATCQAGTEIWTLLEQIVLLTAEPHLPAPTFCFLPAFRDIPFLEFCIHSIL